MAEVPQLKYKELILNMLVGKKNTVFSPELLTIDDMENISSKVVNFKKKYNNIMNENVFDDLEIFQGNSSDKNNSIFDKIDNTKTFLGKNKLKLSIINPLSDISQLNARQSLIKSIYEDENTYKKLCDYLDEICKLEKSILWFWKDKSSETQYLLDSLYFKSSLLSKFNTSETVLQFYNYLKLIISPLYGVLSPVLIMIMPFLYLKFFTNVNISFKVYFRLMKVSFFSFNPLNPLRPNRNSGKMSQIISTIASVFFYLQGVLNSIELSKNTNTLINSVHNILNDVSKFVNLSMKITSVFKPEYIPNESNVEFSLPNSFPKLEDKLFETEPYFSSNKGKILVLFKDIMDDKNKFLPYLNYLSNLDATVSVVKLLKKNKEHYSFTKFIKSKRPLPILNISDVWNPALDTTKDLVKNSINIGGLEANNVVITGPNAGGKSTFIKAVTLSIILSQTLTISPSKSLKMTPFSVINTYLNIPDHKGKDSLFESEMYRAKNHIDKLNNLSKREYSFVVMDEIFSSTNPEEGMSGGFAIGEKLGSFKNSISFITTHFSYLTKLSEKGNFRSFKLPIKRNDKNEIVYPYKLKEGVSDQYIALELLKNKGFDDKLVERAIQVRQDVVFNKLDKKKLTKNFIKKRKKPRSDTKEVLRKELAINIVSDELKEIGKNPDDQEKNSKISNKNTVSVDVNS